jgi:ADP-ribose pyrophosphatase YjhB (NUDIX family)
MTKKAVSCGGVVIHHGKILVLYKNLLNKYEGWVLPKGTVEGDEEYTATALREVKEESGVSAKIIKYIGESTYNFCVKQEIILKKVHWYLMASDNFACRPQKEEYFEDVGYYKYCEAYHLLKFQNEKDILEKAYGEYKYLVKHHLWDNKKYY